MKPRLCLLTALLAFVYASSGCVFTPSGVKEDYTGGIYYGAGLKAEDAGDLTLAREKYWRAYLNPRWGNVPELAAKARFLYEWSRVTGYLGMHEEARQGFEEVLRLIDKGGPPMLTTPTLSELARLLHDTGQHKEAVPVYEQALADLEKRRWPIERVDPIAFAVFLEDYAGSLHAAGFESRADEISRRAASIRDKNKGRAAKFTARRYAAEPSAGGNAR